MTKSEDSATTVVIQRPKNVVKTDARGQTVWAGTIEEIELDLMSSQDLELALEAANDVDRESLRALVESGKDGVVVRDRATGLYDVVSEAELQEWLDTDIEISASKRRQQILPCSEVVNNLPPSIFSAGCHQIIGVSLDSHDRALTHASMMAQFLGRFCRSSLK